MSKAQWLKLSTGTMTDEKIRLIRRMPHGDSYFTLWVGLLCLAMRIESATLYVVDGDTGESIPMGEDEIAHLLDFDDNDIVRKGISIFERYKMTHRDQTGAIVITHFDDHQALEEIDRKRVLATERKRKSRNSFDVTHSERDKSVTCHAPVTQCHATEVEEEVEEELKTLVRVPRRVASPVVPRMPKPDALPDEDFKAVETVWDESYTAEPANAGKKYVRNHGYERKILAPLIRAVGAAEVVRHVKQYFALPAQFWPRTVQKFVDKFNAIDAAICGSRASPVKAPPKDALDLSAITIHSEGG